MNAGMNVWAKFCTCAQDLAEIEGKVRSRHNIRWNEAVVLFQILPDATSYGDFSKFANSDFLPGFWVSKKPVPIPQAYVSEVLLQPVSINQTVMDDYAQLLEEEDNERPSRVKLSMVRPESLQR